MDKMLNWGLLSTARINTRALIPALRASKRNVLVGVASRYLGKANEFAREHQIPRAYGSYEEMLADPNIDVIYIPLPNDLHAKWTIKAAQAGKHILCEKPLALTVTEVEAMTRAARENKVVLAEGLMYRHRLQTQKIQELAASGELGEVRLVRGAYTFKLERPIDIRWNPENGGGSIWDIGWYPISYARMIAGCAPVEVTGMAVPAPSGVDLTFLGELRYPNGMLAQVTSSFGIPYHTHMEIRGSEGTLVVPHPYRIEGETKIMLVKGDKIQELEFDAQTPYLGEVEDMYAAVVEGKTPHVSLVESRDNVATTMALLESARTGKVVKISLE